MGVSRSRVRSMHVEFIKAVKNTCAYWRTRSKHGARKVLVGYAWAKPKESASLLCMTTRWKFTSAQKKLTSLPRTYQATKSTSKARMMDSAGDFEAFPPS